MDNKHRNMLLAKYEVGWWIWHGRKDFAKATDFMIKEYMLQFGIPRSRAKAAVMYRIEAAKMHDKAEELERSGRAKAGAAYWKKAERLIEKHFELLD